MKTNRKIPTAGNNDKPEPSIARRIEKRKVADLTPYHRQDAMFHPLSEPVFKRLVEDMKKNGQLNPIEVTVDGSIIDGHQRVRAARVLAWSEAEVWIRDDLTDDSAIELRHIAANRTRRQLDLLDQVRMSVREFEIKKERSPGQLCAWDKSELKKHVAHQIGRVPRHAQRLLNVVGAPMVIQRAYSNGALKIELADKVHALSKAVQDTIAAEIRSGGDPATIVTKYLPKPKAKPVDVSDEFGKLVAAISVGMDAIAGHEKDIDREVDEMLKDINILKKFAAHSRVLEAALKKRHSGAIRALESFQAKFGGKREEARRGTRNTK